jgi:PPK2 family polyphosphate:nucleotide phosphotransferase
MKRYMVKPGDKVDLDEWDPDDRGEFSGDKERGLGKIQQLDRQLDALQDLLYAEHRHRLLVVLQAMDTAGKDGVIRKVFEGVNPQGVRVATFKQPTPEELDHDYLWRVHKELPARGQIVIFNRSHYEDVLIVRVHNLVPPAVWQKRYDQINEFERMLTEEGTTILKFYLHIDQYEQKKRLQARLVDPDKRWKFNPDDIKERALWPLYLKAYNVVLSKTSTAWAPWFIVPSNSKWYRNLVVAQTLVDTMNSLKMTFPKIKEKRNIAIK